MSAAITALPSDYLMVVQNGVNKKMSLTTLLNNLDSANNIRVNPAQNAINISVASKNDASCFVLSGSTDKIGIGTNSPASKLHIVGNLQVSSPTTDGILVQSSEGIVYTASDQTNNTIKVISPLRAMTQLDCNVGVNGLFSLSSGSNGQVKTIFVNTVDSGKTATISLTGLGFNTITFNAVGKSTTLQWISSISKWVALSNGLLVSGVGATYSTI